PLLVDPARGAELHGRRARLHALLAILPTSHFERFLTTLYDRVGWAEDELRRLAFTAWAEQAPADAARWAETWLPAQNKERAERFETHYFSALGFDGPNRLPRADTANLFLNIQDPALRSRALTQHFTEWRGKD